MAKNLKQLPVITDLENTDLVYAVRPGEADSTADKAISVSNALNYGKIYGQLYLDINAADPTMSITTSPQVISNQYSDVGLFSRTTPNATTGEIVVASGIPDGVCTVSFSMSVSALANDDYAFAMYRNGAAMSASAIIDLNNSNTDGGTLSVTGTVLFSASDVFDMRVWSGGSNTTMTFRAMVLNISPG